VRSTGESKIIRTEGSNSGELKVGKKREKNTHFLKKKTKK
jgi:hypothetical protein